MITSKVRLQGSESRDRFKRRHKDFGNRYACDLDLVLVSKSPPGIVAYLDYKKTRDGITFAECLLYNELIRSRPVYIITGDDPERGPFVVQEYCGGDWKPDPPITHLEERARCASYEALIAWEDHLRVSFCKRQGV